MKKWIATILIFTLSLSLCACGASNQKETAPAQETASSSLQVGFSKVDITPEYSVPMSGSAVKRLSAGKLDFLFTTCVAISDGENTALIFSTDIQNAYSPTAGWRKAVSRKTGIDEDRIMMCFTHTHSAPDTNNADPVIAKYNTTVSDKMCQAATEAIADLSPALAYTTTTQAKNLNFVRRYIMKDESLCGDNFGSTASGYDRHETVADNTLQLIKFTRESGKDIIMANFQTHSNYTLKGSQLSSDVAGAFRDALEKESASNVIYLNGASGNINPISRMENENVVSSHIEWGNKLAQYAMNAATDYTPAKLSTVKTTQLLFTVETNHSEDHLYNQASQISNYFSQTGDSAGTAQMCKEAGISSIYHANSIVSNKGRAETMNIEIDVFAIGDISFIFAPVEMFDTNGMYIKDESPFGTTFICCYANQCLGYMPSALGYENSGYEVVTSMFAPGTAEKVADKYLELLNQLYEVQ